MSTSLITDKYNNGFHYNIFKHQLRGKHLFDALYIYVFE